jgi:sporulation protein YlmC with PRC-barrel domain
MTKKAKALAVALFVAAIAPPAAAQTAAGGNSAADQSFVSKAMPGDWSTSKLIGVSIYGPNDESIGKVNDVVIDGSGAIKAVVVGVGGFLGMGQKNVGLTFSQIKWSDAPLPVKAPPPMGAGIAPPQPSPMAASASQAPAVHDYPDHGSVGLTKDQLKSAPDFHYASEKKAAGG